LDIGGVASCYTELKRLDPESAARLHPNDKSRIMRALGVIMETGTSIQVYQNAHRFEENRYQVLSLGIKLARETLYDRINRRVIAMVQSGLVDEAQDLLDRGYHPELPPLKSIGYKQSFQYLNKKIEMDEMIADIQQKSRHFAKRQMTWYRKDPNINWLEDGSLTEKVSSDVESFLNG